MLFQWWWCGGVVVFLVGQQQCVEVQYQFIDEWDWVWDEQCQYEQVGGEFEQGGVVQLVCLLQYWQQYWVGYCGDFCGEYVNVIMGFVFFDVEWVIGMSRKCGDFVQVVYVVICFENVVDGL